MTKKDRHQRWGVGIIAMALLGLLALALILGVSLSSCDSDVGGIEQGQPAVQQEAVQPEPLKVAPDAPTAVPAPPQPEPEPEPDAPYGTVTAYFLDVGQGDSELVVLNDGTTILIDGGEPSAGGYVVWYVRDVLGYDHIDWMVSSHPHSDHMGGLSSVLLSSIYVANVVALDVAGTSQAYRNFLGAVERTGKQVIAAEAGLVLHDADGCRVELLTPLAGAVYDSLNDYSAVVKVTFGSTAFLFCGDASYKVVGSLGVGHVDVLKAGHHGSSTSTSIPLLEELSPTVAVIEVGWGNDYGHPSVETLDELDYCGVQTWRTDVDGVVVVTSDGRTVSAMGANGASEPTPRAQVEARAAAERAAAQEAVALEAAAVAAALEAAQQGADGESAADPGDGTGAYAAGRIVYITDTGTKYHTLDCKFAQKSSYPIGIEDAKAQGFTPCKVCKPGE